MKRLIFSLFFVFLASCGGGESTSKPIVEPIVIVNISDVDNTTIIDIIVNPPVNNITDPIVLVDNITDNNTTIDVIDPVVDNTTNNVTDPVVDITDPMVPVDNITDPIVNQPVNNVTDPIVDSNTTTIDNITIVDPVSDVDNISVEENPFFNVTFGLFVNGLEFNQTYETNESLSLVHEFLFVNGSPAIDIFSFNVIGNDTYVSVTDEGFLFNKSSFSINENTVTLTVFFIERPKFIHDIKVFDGNILVGTDSIVSFSDIRPSINLKMTSSGRDESPSFFISGENVTFFNAFGRVFDSVDISSDVSEFNVTIINSLSFSVCSYFVNEEKCVDFVDVFPSDVQDDISIIDDGEDINSTGILSFVSSDGIRDVSLLNANYTVVDWNVSVSDNTMEYSFSLYDVRRNTWGEYFAGQTRWLEKIVRPVRERNYLPPFLMLDDGVINVSDKTSIFNNLHSAPEDFARLASTLTDHGNEMLFMYCYTLDIDNCYRDSKLIFYDLSRPSILVPETFNSNYTYSISISGRVCIAAGGRDLCNNLDESYSNIIVSMKPSLELPCNFSEANELCSEASKRVPNKLLFVGSVNELSLREVFDEEERMTPPIKSEILTTQTCLDVERHCLRAIDSVFFAWPTMVGTSTFSRSGTSNSNKVITAVLNSLRGWLFGTNTADELYPCSQAAMMSFAEDRGDPGPDSLWGAGQLSVEGMFDRFGNLRPRQEILKNAVDMGYLNVTTFNTCTSHLVHF